MRPFSHGARGAGRACRCWRRRRRRRRPPPFAAAAAAIRARCDDLLAANAADVAAARAAGISAALIDRLALDAGRVEGIAAGLDTVAALPDPVGATVKQCAGQPQWAGL